MIEACPNIEILILADNLYDNEVMQAACNLQKLVHLELSSISWSRTDIEYLSAAMPDIQSLALKGEVNQEMISVRFANHLLENTNGTAELGGSFGTVQEATYVGNDHLPAHHG